MKKYKTNIKKVIHNLYLIILSILLAASFYINTFFENETVEEMLFYLRSGAINGSADVYLEAIKKCFLFILIVYLILYSLMYNILDIRLFKGIKNKNRRFYPIKLFYNHKIICTILISIIIISVSLYNIKFKDFLDSFTKKSDFIERNYIEPKSENVKFDSKKNLIFIVVESLETTFFTKKQGGDFNYEVMPELYKLLYDKDSIFFSNSDKAGGILDLNCTTWTTAGVVSYNTGLPFKVPIGGNEYYSNNFMSGAYSLGDILKDKGYYNEVISSSRTSFGGIKEFFTKHGSYNIIDENNLAKYNYNIGRDKNEWGFNDKLLFEIAKDRLNKISKAKKPFNLSLLTINTHHRDGINTYYTKNKYDTQYENVYAVTSSLIYNFVSWVKKQAFYEDTTIVIVGDHLSMQTDYFKKYNQDKRKRYNVIINSSIKTNNTYNRMFTSVDMYPTILAAMGADIKDNGLGLGVNLFSKRKTFAEVYGIDYMNKEVIKNSKFYNDKILKSDYIKMKNAITTTNISN